MDVTTSCKRSAIHNLRIDAGGPNHESTDSKGIDEGLALPESLRVASDLVIGEAVIVARINGDNRQNRVRTFVSPTTSERVEVRGSLGHFLSQGDLVCVISETRLDAAAQRLHRSGDLHIVDYGIVPGQGFEGGTLKHERLGRADEVAELTSEMSVLRESLMPRIMLNSLITDLVVNDTNENCLLGSAEIPGILMDQVGMTRHTMVTVFNASAGGCTDTYAVPMPPGVVMTTGAMAGFAPLGTRVHVASFAVADATLPAAIVQTDGSSAI
ncbi:aspartate 1-decarboxylase [Micromonospora sp. NPDC005172]|uniref:aspartate 1-decarboxylase n=1 Tax=Micromonospora sp. NPDC005172 TaxID=3156867 RepID=UPI0033B5BB6D